MTGLDDTLKTVAAVAAAMTAVVGISPAVADARRRRTPLTAPPKGIRIERLVAPRPWWDGFNRIFVDPDDKAVKWVRRSSIATAGFFALAIGALTYTYWRVGKGQGLSPWWLALGMISGALVAGILLFWVTFVLVVHPKRGTLAGTRSGYVLVSGAHDEVLHHCQVALLAMGARLISVRTDEVVAATGTTFGPLWLGNRVVVTLGATPKDRLLVRVSSTKLDYITTSRSKKDVVRFVSSWISESHGKSS